MPSLKEVRSEVIDAIIEKHVSSKLNWSPREGEASFEARVGRFVFHIDRKPVGARVGYKVWIFDDLGNDLDSFDTSALDDVIPKNGGYESYTKAIASIYRQVKESQTLDQILPALSTLRSL